MRRIPSNDPQRIVYASSRTILKWCWGLPFVVAGLGFLALSLFAPGKGNLWGAIACGMAFIAMGLARIGEYSSFEVDLRSRTYTSSWGVFWSWRERSGPLGSGAAVRIAPYPQSEAFPHHVGVVAGGMKPYTLSQHRSYEEARIAACSLARELQLKVCDATFGGSELVDPDVLMSSLQDRLQRGECALPPLRDPPECVRRVLSLDASKGSMELSIPAVGVRGKQFLTLLAALSSTCAVFFAAGLWVIPGVARWVFMIGSIVFAILGAIAALHECLSSVTLNVDRDRLQVRVQWLWRTSTFVPLFAIQDIAIAQRHVDARGFRGLRDAVVVRSTTGTVAFAAHLPREDKEWIRDALIAYLAAGGTSTAQSASN